MCKKNAGLDGDKRLALSGTAEKMRSLHPQNPGMSAIKHIIAQNAMLLAQKTLGSEVIYLALLQQA
eukprot:scaffold220221_cov21-Tisochrysis_lutea.AAC.1